MKVLNTQEFLPTGEILNQGEIVEAVNSRVLDEDDPSNELAFQQKAQELIANGPDSNDLIELCERCIEKWDALRGQVPESVKPEIEKAIQQFEESISNLRDAQAHGTGNITTSSPDPNTSHLIAAAPALPLVVTPVIVPLIIKLVETIIQLLVAIVIILAAKALYDSGLYDSVKGLVLEASRVISEAIESIKRIARKLRDRIAECAEFFDSLLNISLRIERLLSRRVNVHTANTREICKNVTELIKTMASAWACIYEHETLNKANKELIQAIIDIMQRHAQEMHTRYCN
ncbi:MAG: hypothetical protein ACPGN3_14910 [Opitutales bacterium]